MKVRTRSILFIWVTSLIAACGGGGSGGGGSSGGVSTSSSFSSVTSAFTVGGTVSGLTGSGLVLQNNGGNDLPVTVNGTVIFSSALTSGAAYNITVKTQPTSTPAQTCAVTNGNGMVASTPVTNIAITCRNLVGKFLYISNFNDRTISGYSIDATTGALTAVGSTGPIGVGLVAFFTVDPSEKFLYLSSGGASAAASISGFSINSATGALSPTPNSPYAAGPADAVVFNPIFELGSKFVYLQKFLSLTSVGYSFNANSGELTALANANPFPVVSTFSGTFNAANGMYYVLDNSQPASVKLSAYEINSTTGVATLSGFVSTGTTVGNLTSAPSNKFLYMTASNAMSGFSVNSTSGMLTPFPGPPVQIAPSGINLSTPIFHPTGKFAYLVGQTIPPSTPTTVYAISLDAITGVMSPIGAGLLTGGTSTAQAYVHPSGKFLLMMNRAPSPSLTVFGIDQVTGALTPVVNSPFPLSNLTQATLLIADPSGRFFYITDSSANTVTPVSFDSNNGTVTLGTTIPTGLSPQFGRIVGLQ